MQERGITITTAFDEEKNLVNAVDEIPSLEAGLTEQLSLVEEIVQLFAPRVANNEITPWELAEAFALAASGAIMSLVPPHQIKSIEREAEVISRYMLKKFDEKSKKKNMMFASQILGATKFSSYVVAHGARALTDFKAQKESNENGGN